MATIADIIVGAAQKYGVDPQALLGIARIESGLDPSARNPNSSAGGLFQFIDSTAQQYGLADRFDPMQAADAAARLARDNAAGLRSALGRDPNSAELYLAHQQGLGGARKILSNPGASLGDLVGQAQARLNGGAGLTGAQFAQMWQRKMQAALGQAGSGADVAPASPGAQLGGAPPAPGGGTAAASPQIDPALLQLPGISGLLASRRPPQEDQQRAEQEARRRALLGSIGEMYA
jgi:hypothetical protein